MNKAEVEYSVIIPVYNSEEGLHELYTRLTNTFRKITDSYEIIMVDDCSRDRSWAVLENLNSKDKKVKIIRLMKNFGQHNALMCGFNYAKGKYVITMDDDLQHPPEEIPKLIKKIKDGYNVVYGQYRHKEHGWFRNLASGIINCLLKKVAGNTYTITSFRIIDRKVVENITKFTSYNVFVDVFISNLVASKSVGHVKVEHNARKYRKTSYSLKSLFIVASNMVFNHTIFPLRLATIMGLAFSFVSVVIGIYYLIKYLFDEIIVSGFTSLILSITFFSGIILFVLGIIGEYIGRIFLNANNKPQYVIDEIKV